MGHLKNYGRFKIAAPILIGIGLLFIPLVGDFHIESALLVSLVGCFWAGIRATGGSKEKDFYAALSIVGYLFMVGLPLLINAVATGCFSIHGLAFWLLFPLPSVFFGYATGRLIRSLTVSYARTTFLTMFGAAGRALFMMRL
jgi:hypothetical protein